MELHLIDEEEKAMNNNGSNDEAHDSEEMSNLYEEMWGDEDDI